MTSETGKLVLSGAVGLLALALSGCGGGEPSQAASATQEEARVNVVVLELAPESLTERVALAGKLEPWVEVSLASELGGTVEQVAFAKGQHVRKGEVLARVGTDLLEAALRGAEARMAAAAAVYEKTEKLFEAQHVPRQELIAAKAEFGAAKAALEQARLRRERSIIRAPLSGIAVTREVEPGEVLSPGAAVTTLHRVDQLKATAGIPESEIAGFDVGSAATVEVDAFPDRTFEGRVRFIGPATEGASRTFPVEIAVANAAGDLRPGMVARVSLVKNHYDDVVVIDRDILQDRDHGPVAVVLQDDGTASVRDLVLGASDANRVLVRKGLSIGERLIVSGQRGLVTGQKVKVVERRP
jgi:membrane fusion protein (multidrug efflux system)